MNKDQQNLELAKLHGWTIIGKSTDAGPSYGKTIGFKIGENLLGTVVVKDNYLDDFNLIYSLEAHLGLHDPENLKDRVRWVTFLHAIVGRRCPLNNSGFPVVSDIEKMFARKSERCEAILKTYKKWEK